MRSCFCDGRLVAASTGYALEAKGLNKPALLLPHPGEELPDLSPHVGRVVSMAGLLKTPVDGGNQESLLVEVAELQISANADDPATGPMMGLFTGNIGKAPEVSPNSNDSLQRATTSLAYFSDGKNTAWLRLSCLSYLAAYDEFCALPQGASLAVAGTISHYDYSKKSRLELVVRTFDLLKAGGGGMKAPDVLYKAPSASGVSPEPIPGF